MEEYLWQNHIAFKDYGEHVNSVSGRVKEQFLKPFQERNLPVVFERDPETDKEEMARALAVQHKIESGPVCAISAMEPSPTFEYCKSHIASRVRPCPVFYRYEKHGELGWMYSRIQTWFPFRIRIGLNGSKTTSGRNS